MIDYSKIIQKKYLDFFTSKEAKRIQAPNTIMDDFFCDMRKISENMPSDVAPTEVILNVFEKNKSLFENEGELLGFDKIVILASSDNLNTLSEQELFTILWYCSCRNVFAYQEGYYVSMTRNGVNGRLLKAMSNFPLFRPTSQAAIGYEQG